MNRSMTRWTTAVAAATLIVLPAAGLAQTPDPQKPATPTAQTDTDATAEATTPEEHLRKARQALSSIEMSDVTGETRTRLNELRQHVNRLERAVAENDRASETAVERRSEQATADARGNVQWEIEVAAIDRILTELVGPAATTGAAATTGTPGAVGTTGAAPATLDAATLSKLTEVRRHITAFAEAKRGSAAPDEAVPSSTYPATGEQTPTSTTQQAPTQPPTDPTRSDPPATQPAAAGTAAQMGIDETTARQHLTAARNTLSELTQLPAASQLTGEDRTQVAELISNFNEMITTGTAWRDAYVKVEANLNALIGPEMEQPAAATETGAVGTSGTAATLDPEIRAKLIEFRNHLEKFERAAGQPSDTGAGAAATTDTGAAMSGHTATQPHHTEQEPQTPHHPQTPQTPQQPQTHQQHQSPQDVLRHIEAIEAILSGRQPTETAGTTGTMPPTPPATPPTTTETTLPATVTLDSAQLQQIRTHLNELRRLAASR